VDGASGLAMLPQEIAGSICQANDGHGRYNW
jgi:hypothetical protein